MCIVRQFDTFRSKILYSQNLVVVGSHYSIMKTKLLVMESILTLIEIKEV
jgi:hypothetical protein